MRLQSLLSIYAVPIVVLSVAACSEAGGDTQATTGGSSTGGVGIGGTASGGAGAAGANGCTPHELLTNGNFDAGGSGWTESSGKWPAVIVTAAMTTGNVMPQSGSHLARFGGYPDAAQDNLISTVNVPTSATNIVFSYYSIVTSQETSAERRDSLFLSLDSDIQYVEQVLDNTTVHAAWQRYQMPIDPQAAGKTLVLLMRAENDGMNATTFLIDSMSLIATACP